MSNGNSIDWAAWATAAFELAIAAAIVIEVEGTRLDKFLEDVESQSKRKRIFAKFCGLKNADGKNRRQQFKDMLFSAEARRVESASARNGPGSDESPLWDICDENIRLFSRVGARLPWFPPYRKTALEWHVVVFLWWILGPYVIARRSLAGPTFAKTFLTYALASTKTLLGQKRDNWTIFDPDAERSTHVVVTRNELEGMCEELSAEIERKG